MSFKRSVNYSVAVACCTFYCVRTACVFLFYWLERGLRRGKLTREEMLLPLLPIILIAAILFGGSISVIRAVLAYGMTVLLRLFSCHLSACDRYGIVLFLTLMIDPKVFLQTSGQLCF